MEDKTVKKTAKIRNKKGQFEKGNQEGSRAGRPKKEICIPDILRELLNEPNPFDPEKKQTALNAICKKAINLAIGGDRDARNWVADRFEGKARETIKIEDDGIQHIFLFPTFEGDEEVPEALNSDNGNGSYQSKNGGNGNISSG
jgi:hypothetical protein